MKNEKLIDRCILCRKIKFHLRFYEWDTAPGSGRFGYVCQDCWPCRPLGFQKTMGFNNGLIKPNAQFVRFIGNAVLTDGRQRQNAWGFVLALYDDGSKLPVTCTHGGSMWLCPECAQAIMKDQSEIVGGQS